MNAVIPSSVAYGMKAVLTVLKKPAKAKTDRAPYRVYRALNGKVEIMLARPTTERSWDFSSGL
jgi:hypothetical protein